MGLTNEAAYLYVHSKELVTLTRKLKRLSKKAEKHAHRHQKAEHPEDKQKHQKRHTKVSENIKDIVKRHNFVIKRLREHQVAFAHALGKETKIE
jgi:hypothetical protein